MKCIYYQNINFNLIRFIKFEKYLNNIYYNNQYEINYSGKPCQMW
jgi:hypothetical protein